MIMEDAIYLLQADETLVEMHAAAYESEPVLQKLLADYPHLLAGGQMNPDNPRRWLLVGRELGIAWEEGGPDQLSLDHLFLDQDGIPTLVEVKRSSDTRIRREVVGQMLEYAANAVAYWPVEKLRARYEAYCEQQGLDPSHQIQDLVNGGVEDEVDIEQFWQTVNTNLQAGRIRMLFVADEIPSQLRRIVEFLNGQMSEAEVLAIEVKQYVGQGLKTLVPRVVGQTAQAQQRKAMDSPTISWTEEKFFTELANRKGDVEAEVAQGILEWAKVHMPDIWWGKGKRNGSFVPGLNHDGQWHQLIGVWTNGFVEVEFQYMKSRGSLDDRQRLELLRRINASTGVDWPETHIIRRPSIPLAILAAPNVLPKFFADLEWALGEIVAGAKSDGHEPALTV